MFRSVWVSAFLLLFGLAAAAQEADRSGASAAPNTYLYEDHSLEEMLPGLRDRAVVLDIIARVLEQNKAEIWNESHRRVTIPGRPVGLKLVGANIVIAMQFIPYIGNSGESVLIAQGQIWVDIPKEGITYRTTMTTIPIQFEEPIYFFPLGSSDKEDDANIEIMLTMRPYRDQEAAEAAPPGTTESGNQETDNSP